ncbi:hypothetical protein JTB14_003993 [Gonioctena quinquepunctata]|nr:hypothetical protein JTB14_003993 [Gonioctena quinquepunctata]
MRTNLTTLNHTLGNNLQRYLKAQSPFTIGAASEYLGFINVGTPEGNVPDVEFISVSPTLLYRKITSRLPSNSAEDPPKINGNYSSDPRNEDIETMYKGIKFVSSPTETDAFRNINSTHIDTYPGCEELRETGCDRDFWYCAIRHITSTVYYPTGTTRMGSSPKDSVVDENCMVHHMENLRVVDAAVMPRIIRGHTNAATNMIAEKISDIIKKFHDKNGFEYGDEKKEL